MSLLTSAGIQLVPLRNQNARRTILHYFSLLDFELVPPIVRHLIHENRHEEYFSDGTPKSPVENCLFGSFQQGHQDFNQPIHEMNPMDDSLQMLYERLMKPTCEMDNVSYLYDLSKI